MSIGNPVNAAYYGQTSTGRDDYWRKMAAPRFRVATMLKLLAEEPARTVVDLGCGGGNLLSEIRARRPDMKLAGVDLSLAQIEVNRTIHPDVRWFAADLSLSSAAAELPAGSFDAVVASEIVEHVADPLVFLANALRLARPGGRLLLSTQSGPVRETERRVGHVRHFTDAEMSRVLHDAGWHTVRVWNAGFPFHDLSKWYANRDPDASMRRFGERGYGWKEDLICLALRLAFELNSSRRGAQLFAVARRGEV
ncbi:MAG: class I SAM-dependent methyltransferase [Polyangiaceae bacterium]